MKRFSGVVVLAVMVLAICGTAWADVAIDETNFPDANFRQYVLDNVDTDGDGTLDDSEISSTTEIIVHSKSISSLTGIEHFSALQKLNCGNNQLTALDVSNNTALQMLYCNNNQLTDLDLSKNAALTYLNCWENQLTDLDLSKNTALTGLVCNFPIDSDDVNYTFNLPAFMNAYTLPRSGMSYIDFRYTYTGGIAGGIASSSLTVDSSSMSNAVSFTVPDETTLLRIDFTITFSDGPNISVVVFPASGSTPSPGTSIRSPLITTTDFPDGTVSTPYSADLTAIGATPITWSITDGSLPDGLTLDASGKISGTPTATGIFTFTVQASNIYGTDTKSFTVLVPFSEARAPKITTETLTNGYTNSPYGFRITATGTAPLTWSLEDGTLPEGLAFSDTGYISGTPETAGTSSFTVKVSNDAGTDTAAFTLSISESPLRTRPAVMTENPEPATKDKPYICQLMSLGTPPFKWTVKGKLPSGLTMNDAGLITGTPTKAATKKLAFTVSNDYGEETRTLTLKVWTLPEITTKTLKDAIIGKKYNSALKKKGTTPVVWEIEGSLPQGITMFNADSAKIIGVPVSLDKGMVRVTLSNAVGEASRIFTLKVGAVKPVLKPSKLANGTYGKNYTASIKATKGTTPITLRLSADLPAGLSFDSGTGMLGGTPQEACKNLPVTVIAVNLWGVVSKDYKLTVKAVNPKITTTKLADATAGTEYSADLEATGTQPITWSATGLPAGLNISEGGQISGTPTAAGKFSVKVTASNAGKSAKKTLKLTVAAAPAENAGTAPAARNNGTLHGEAESWPEAGEGFSVVNGTPVPAVGGGSAGVTYGYVVVAVLPEVSGDVSGMYDFIATLSDDAQPGDELVYLAGSSEPSDDDNIAEFSDETGAETSTVPESKKVTVSVWLKEGVTYSPSIAVKH